MAELYDLHGGLCYRAARAACGSSTMAEDAVQEVFMRIAHDPAKLRGVGNLIGYLLRMAQNAAIDQVRRAARRPQAPLGDPVSPEPDADAERDQRVAKALADLPDDQREVVVLRVWENRSLEETGHILGISANTVASRWRYALEKLGKSLKGVHHVG